VVSAHAAVVPLHRSAHLCTSAASAKHRGNRGSTCFSDGVSPPARTQNDDPFPPELHSDEVDQRIVILPLAIAVVKSFLPDQQPFDALAPVKKADRSFALADSDLVIERADIDLDLEPPVSSTKRTFLTWRRHFHLK